MEKKTIIDLIKKCKKDSSTLSLQKTDDALGVKAYCCSTFLKSSGLLAQGELNILNSDKRNPVVTFRNPKTGNIKGEDF